MRNITALSLAFMLFCSLPVYAGGVPVPQDCKSPVQEVSPTPDPVPNVPAQGATVIIVNVAPAPIYPQSVPDITSDMVRLQSRGFLVLYPVFSQEWDLKPVKNEIDWLDVVAYDRPYVIGPGILEPIKKIVMVTEDGKRYESTLVPAPLLSANNGNTRPMADKDIAAESKPVVSATHQYWKRPESRTRSVK